MTNYTQFQTQMTTIMETMAKSAIIEITKLFDDSSSVLCTKIFRSLHENDALKRKLKLLHQELRTARGQKKGIAGARESPVNTRSVGVQVLESHMEEPYSERIFGQGCSFRLKRDGERPGVEQSASMVEVRPGPALIKEETTEEDLRYRDRKPALVAQVMEPTPGEEGLVTQTTPATEEQVTLPTPVEDGKKPYTEPTPAGDPEELSEQHRCEHGDEELNGLEFVVKAEQEEDRLAQRLNQTGSEDSAGRLNDLGSEYVMYERDSQLGTSFIQDDSDIETNDPVNSKTTEQCSPSLSIHTQLQHAPATMEFSGNALSSFGRSYVEFDEIGEKPSVCGVELRSEAIHTQQGQYRERLVHTVERENQTLLPQQQQHGPSVTHMRGSESPAQPHSGSQYETGSTLGTSAFNAGNNGQIDEQVSGGRKPFVCIYCGKSFDCCSRLISHHRIHTGEKPFSCAHCGRCFNRKSNLVRHERIHSGNKPFGCTLCGKRFAWGPDLGAHHRIHTGERPYHCTYCGKSFARQCNLVVHRRIHTRAKLYSCI